MNIANATTVLGLVNGMVGGVVLILPLLALNAGYAFIVPIAIVVGFFSYYSSVLCMRHLCNYRDIDQAMLYHFGGRKCYKTMYDIVIVVSLTILLFTYFKLICDQWIGFFGYHVEIPIFNGLGVLVIVYILKICDAQGKFFSVGIVSIFGYCIFLIWSLANAPQGKNELPPTDPLFIDLAAALAEGFALQSFFIPILKQNKNKKQHGKLLLISYIIGIIIYVYVSYFGAFSILNRKQWTNPAKTIEDYFEPDHVGVTLLEAIYLFHLYSTFPIFIKISREQFFHMFNGVQEEEKLKFLVFNATNIFVCVMIAISQVEAKSLIIINGAIVGFFQIYFMPMLLNVKCLYFSTPEEHKVRQTLRLEKIKNKNTIQTEKQMKKSSQQMEPEIGSSKSLPEPQKEEEEEDRDICSVGFKNKVHEYCEIVLMVLMVLMGVVTFAYVVYVHWLEE